MRSMVCLALVALSSTVVRAEAPVFKDKIERGKYYFNTSGCMNCHSPDRDRPLTGGKKMETDFGIFYTPNISSDKVHGIGNWTDREFIRAVKYGISPNNEYYYPAFSFPTYSKMTDEDVVAIKAYIDSLPPMNDVNKDHEIKFPMNNRNVMIAWRALNFRTEHNSPQDIAVFKYQGTFRPVQGKSSEWNRGAYLVESTLHCTECHTPRNKLGGLISDKWMTGAPFAEEKKNAGNITPDIQTGIGKWSNADLKSFLQDGGKPDGMDVGGEMYRIIRYGTAQLSDSDLNAVVTYLKSLKPMPTSIVKK